MRWASCRAAGSSRACLPTTTYARCGDAVRSSAHPRRCGSAASTWGCRCCPTAMPGTRPACSTIRCHRRCCSLAAISACSRVDGWPSSALATPRPPAARLLEQSGTGWLRQASTWSPGWLAASMVMRTEGRLAQRGGVGRSASSRRASTSCTRVSTPTCGTRWATAGCCSPRRRRACRPRRTGSRCAIASWPRCRRWWWWSSHASGVARSSPLRRPSSAMCR